MIINASHDIIFYHVNYVLLISEVDIWSNNWLDKQELTIKSPNNRVCKKNWQMKKIVFPNGFFMVPTTVVLSKKRKKEELVYLENDKPISLITADYISN